MRIKEINCENFKKNEIRQELTGRDIFCGPNESGKSARLEAVQLGLFGYIPEIGKFPSSTMVYSLGNKMYIELRTDDGITIQRTFKRHVSKKGKVSYKKDLEILPLQRGDKEDAIADKFGLSTELIDFNEFLKKPAGQRKQFISDICAKHIKEKSTKDTVSSVCDVGSWNDELSDIENLNKIEEDYKEKISQLRKDLKAQENHKYRMMEAQKVEINKSKEECEEEIKNVESQIADLMEKKSKAKAEAGQKDNLSFELKRIEKELSHQNKLLEDMRSEKEILKEKLEKEKRLEKLESQIKKINKDIADADKKLERVREDYRVVSADIKAKQKLLESFSNDFCPCIDEKCPKSEKLQSFIDNGSKEVEDLNNKLKSIESSGEKHKSDISSMKSLKKQIEEEMSDIPSDIKRLDDELKDINKSEGIRKEISRLEKRHSEINKQLSESSSEDTSKMDKLIMGFKNKKEELVKERDKSIEYERARVQIEKTNVAIIDIEEKIEEARDVVEFVGKDGKKGDLLKKSFKPIVEKMNELLESTGLSTDIKVDSEDKDKFDMFMIEPEGRVNVEALSDGATILFATAFICALQQLNETKCKILLIEASELDDEKFGILVSSLSEFGEDVDNILIARISVPEEVPGEWSVNDLR